MSELGQCDGDVRLIAGQYLLTLEVAAIGNNVAFISLKRGLCRLRHVGKL